MKYIRETMDLLLINHSNRVMIENSEISSVIYLPYLRFNTPVGKAHQICKRTMVFGISFVNFPLKYLYRV